MNTYQLLFLRTLPTGDSALEIKFEYSGTNIAQDVEEFAAQRYPEWCLQEVMGPGYGYLHNPMLGNRFNPSKMF